MFDSSFDFLLYALNSWALPMPEFSLFIFRFPLRPTGPMLRMLLIWFKSMFARLMLLPDSCLFSIRLTPYAGDLWNGCGPIFCGCWYCLSRDDSRDERYDEELIGELFMVPFFWASLFLLNWDALTRGEESFGVTCSCLGTGSESVGSCSWGITGVKKLLHLSIAESGFLWCSTLVFFSSLTNLEVPSPSYALMASILVSWTRNGWVKASHSLLTLVPNDCYSLFSDF